MIQEFHIGSVTFDADYNPNSVITLYVHHRNTAFRICYDPEILAASPIVLEQHHAAYSIMCKDDLGEKEHREVVNHLRRPFEELMDQMAPNLVESPRYLHRYLYPQWFILEARVEEGSSYIQPHFKEVVSLQAILHPGDCVNNIALQPHLSPLLHQKPKKYASCQVQILDQTVDWVPSRVLVDDKEYFFKPWVKFRDTYHELQSYGKILADTEASQPLLADTRICHLHGLVIDHDDDFLQHYPIDSNEELWSTTRLVGLLLTYIENRGSLAGVASQSDYTNEDRLRWSMQIQNCVNSLHEAGVVWGDVKPENVLVDMKGDAWIIDFGGSYTEGWVDEDKQETVEGDLQGVQRIGDWLQNCPLKPVTCDK